MSIVQIPCDRDFDSDGDSARCGVRGELCPNCTAIRELRAACEMVLERWSFNNDQRHTHTWHDREDCAKVIRDALAKYAEPDHA